MASTASQWESLAVLKTGVRFASDGFSPTTSRPFRRSKANWIAAVGSAHDFVQPLSHLVRLTSVELDIDKERV